ncbi:choice-of-anchor M domain-containing protein [Glycomyces harbinensis]|uniref:Surface-anchored protein n=1 Tax=Glycomyces harbinensis TaxID=58114 RepID=A0A1G7AMY5_9ACTN|nr:choice-of-anchor M domain-containing protein [Glycomyces harbinensis]SDE16152.1 surface-anchored protein [Glycomyces harbinensis]
MRTIVKYAAAAAAAAAALATAAAPATAQGSTLTVLSEGHVDAFGIAYEDGALDLHVHDEENDAEHAPSDVLLAVNREAKTTAPAGYDFLDDGDADVWILPDTHVEGLLFPGWATEEIAPGDFADDTLTITVHDAWGDVDLYTVDDLGDPTVLFDSDQGPGSWDVTAGGHGHLNWAFGEAGLYKLTVEAEGELAATGETVSTGEVDYWFWVEK